MEQNNQSHFQYQLHSVRKPSFKPWKKPLAPLPPVRPKVYKIDTESFKQVVQELTAEHGYKPLRLKNLAPPPLSVSTNIENKTTMELLPSLNVTLAPTWNDIYKELTNDGNIELPPSSKEIESSASLCNFGLDLSPTNSYGWCSSLLSPGTISSFE